MLGGALRSGVIAALLSIVLAACGTASHLASSSGGGSVTAAEATELSYIAPGSPFVAAIATSGKSLLSGTSSNLLNADPSAASLLSLLSSRLGLLGLSYGHDIKPLFGNPVMLAIGTPAAGTRQPTVLAVWETASQAVLGHLIGKLSFLHSSATIDGAKVYALGSQAAVAISGATILLSQSAEQLRLALQRHTTHAGFSSVEYARLAGTLGAHRRVTFVGDLTSLLSTPKAATARKVPWVAALRGYGVDVSGSRTQIGFHFRVDTGGAPLSAAQLPLDPAAGAPQLAGQMPITVGVSDAAHTWKFIETAAELAGAKGFAKFLVDQAKVKARTGANLDDLVSQFTGPAIVGSDTITTIGRAQVADGQKAATTLALLAKDPSDALQSVASARAIGGGLYQVIQRHGKPLIVGVIGNEFVIGAGPMAAIRAFATAPATPAPGPGSLAFRIALPQLLEMKLHTRSPIAALVLGRLGDLTGSASNTTSALTGGATLAFKSAG